MKLTKRIIDAAEYEGEGSNGRHVLWDAEIPGFGCRIYPTGRKAFVLSYRVDGRKRLITLGTYGVLTLDQGRKAAREALSKVETRREDPLEERQRAAQGETLGDLCIAYMERYAKAHKKSWVDDERRIRKRLLPRWGNLKARAIKRADVAALHNEIGVKEGKRYEANRVAELLSKMFDLARRWGFVPEDQANPARDLDHFREEKRDRWVSPEELPLLARAIDAEPNQTARFALWLYLLTGARKSELLTAQWADVDLSRAELRLPDTKSGRIHYIPLSRPALSLLEQIPREEGNPYILPGRDPGTHLVNINKPWNRVREAATLTYWESLGDSRIDKLLALLGERLGRRPAYAEVRGAADFDLPSGIRDVRLHDLRRTVGSWLAQSGNSLHLIGKVLNHSNPSTTAVYARFGEDQVRNAMEQHGERIMGIAGFRETK